MRLSTLLVVEFLQMSREHFHESQIEDRITELMKEGMSDEEAIQIAESEYHGQVNLVEDQALRIHKRAYEMNKEDIQKKLRQGLYPSEIVLAMVVDYLQEHYNNEDQIRSTRQFCRKLLTKINDDTLEVNNAE